MNTYSPFVPLVRSAQSIWAVVSATLISLWLFYIDEGYYDFRWMNHWLNWFWLLVYIAGIWGVQVLASRFLFKRYAVWEQVVLNIVLGVPIAVTLMISVLILMGKIARMI